MKKKFTKKKIRKNIDKIINSKFFFQKKKLFYFLLLKMYLIIINMKLTIEFNNRLPEIAHKGIDKINK